MDKSLSMEHCPYRPEVFRGATPVHMLPMVYVLVAPAFEFINLQISCAFKARLHHLQAYSTNRLNLWSAIRTPKPMGDMTDRHEWLAHVYLQGHWLKSQTADPDAVMVLCTLTNRNVKEVHRALLQA